MPLKSGVRPEKALSLMVRRPILNITPPIMRRLPAEGNEKNGGNAGGNAPARASSLRRRGQIIITI
ncbi:MAG TPA: hypothetical protein IAC75_00635 [Candidatus Spyradosoma merdigallinarum]|uniref:Uncharacterized protein n=1 Tax=Candidatus Spyradosoma merdigallinarum TaxID=2840950 RepID=A0A9D1NIC1_9BACT|nr:hypothetical protein [Candidatus Spyradosoma merdigallinarum]